MERTGASRPARRPWFVGDRVVAVGMPPLPAQVGAAGERPPRGRTAGHRAPAIYSRVGLTVTVGLLAINAAVVLAPTAGLHAAWAAGSSWPAADRRGLADAVTGTPVMPDPPACWTVAVALTAAAAVTAGAGRQRRLAVFARAGVSTQLHGSANIVRSDQLSVDAAAGRLPQLSMVWHDSPYDEHPVADVRLGQDAIWQAVTAVAAAGLWDDTVFLLTWDDWGGFDDHVAAPDVEHTPDGVQLAYGPRVPLLLFGGRVRPGIDSRWTSHVSIGRTCWTCSGCPRSGCPASTTHPHCPIWSDPQPAAAAAAAAADPGPRAAPAAAGRGVRAGRAGPAAGGGGGTLPAPDDQPIPPVTG